MKYLFVFDFFAGTFSVTKACFQYNQQNQNNQTQVYGVFGVEKEKSLCFDFLESQDYERLNFQFFQIFCSDILTVEFHEKLILSFKKQILLGKAKHHGCKFGALLFAGPPCVNYSNLQNFNMKQKYIQDAHKFQKKQQYSDRLVQQTLDLFFILQEICIVEGMSCNIIIENPWSSEFLKVRDQKDLFFDNNYKYVTELSLRKRPFFKKYFVENGGFLYTTKHNWCEYDYLFFPKKPTAIFSSLHTLQSKICIHRG